MAARAEETGYSAICMTVDAKVKPIGTFLLGAAEPTASAVEAADVAVEAGSRR